MLTILKERTEEIEKVAAKYPSRRSAMLPVLWMVQQQEGWISQEAMEEVAEVLGSTVAEVYEVVSFYTMFQQKPVGKTHLALCDTLACAVCGSMEAAEYLKTKYGIQKDKVTPDGRFSLEYVECIGACSIAPAMLVGEVLHGNLTPESLDRIIASCP
ncbi:MAG: NADH-quinone oxidoreductase subunit [Candidatus Sumerlaeota bacterium]|nr:NADH-quinone oxidoreductase subunit [Candidatus Sumerlaeota bacterium]